MKNNLFGEWRIVLSGLVAGASMLVSDFAIHAGSGRQASYVPAMSAPTMLPATTSISRPVSAGPVVSVDELSQDLLIESIVQIESAGKPDKVGSRGERGLMQIKQETWAQMTREEFGRSVSFCRAFEPALNRQIGSAYLESLHDFIKDKRNAWKSDERSLLLACYNAGPSAVERAGFDINQLPSSTQDYVTRASALHDHYLREFEIPGSGTWASLRDPRNG